MLLSVKAAPTSRMLMAFERAIVGSTRDAGPTFTVFNSRLRRDAPPTLRRGVCAKRVLQSAWAASQAVRPTALGRANSHRERQSKIRSVFPPKSRRLCSGYSA
jgi:hypothetical protein